MRTLYYVGLEPLKERYTGAWAQWLPSLFARNFVVVDVPGTPLTQTVTKGTFLDVNSSAHYKATQLSRIAEMFHKGQVESGSVFWFSDIEFNGLDMVRYLATLNGVDIRIVGFLHAASYIRGDLMETMKDVGVFSEPLWVRCCDRVCVGSQHSKDIFLRSRIDHLPLSLQQGIEERIVVTGNPFRSWEVADPSLFGKEQRRVDVVFPHRPDSDKRPAFALRAIEDCARRVSLGRKLRVVFTTGRRKYTGSGASELLCVVKESEELSSLVDLKFRVGLDRSQFFSILRSSRVALSTGVEETFGYAMVEAMAAGCIPVAPWAYAYPEYAMQQFSYRETAAEDEVGAALAGALEWARSSAADLLQREAHHSASRFDLSEGSILRVLAGVYL